MTGGGRDSPSCFHLRLWPSPAIHTDSSLLAAVLCLATGMPMQIMLGRLELRAVVVTEIAQCKQAEVRCISDPQL